MSRCPHCGKPAAPDYKPFCSKRCADVDLARWLRGDYALPGPEGEVDPDLSSGDPDQHG